MREVGGLECAAEDRDGVVLCGDIVEGLWAAGRKLAGASRNVSRSLVLFLHPWLQSVVLDRCCLLGGARLSSSSRLTRSNVEEVGHDAIVSSRRVELIEMKSATRCGKRAANW